jgi:hypothetical protein
MSDERTEDPAPQPGHGYVAQGPYELVDSETGEVLPTPRTRAGLSPEEIRAANEAFFEQLAAAGSLGDQARDAVNEYTRAMIAGQWLPPQSDMLSTANAVLRAHELYAVCQENTPVDREDPLRTYLAQAAGFIDGAHASGRPWKLADAVDIVMREAEPEISEPRETIAMILGAYMDMRRIRAPQDDAPEGRVDEPEETKSARIMGGRLPPKPAVAAPFSCKRCGTPVQTGTLEISFDYYCPGCGIGWIMSGSARAAEITEGRIPDDTNSPEAF